MRPLAIFHVSRVLRVPLGSVEISLSSRGGSQAVIESSVKVLPVPKEYRLWSGKESPTIVRNVSVSSILKVHSFR